LDATREPSGELVQIAKRLDGGFVLALLDLLLAFLSELFVIGDFGEDLLGFPGELVFYLAHVNAHDRLRFYFGRSNSPCCPTLRALQEGLSGLAAKKAVCRRVGFKHLVRR
jgi:hypothetical protein